MMRTSTSLEEDFGMTTILADYHAGVMVCDSNATDGDRNWVMRKVYRIRGALVGCAGNVPEFEAFLSWYRGGMTGKLKFDADESTALVLQPDGLFLFDDNLTQLQRVKSGREAAGSGGKAAISAYEALDWQNPQRAVRIACKNDAGSRPPVRTYHLRKGIR